MDMAEAADDGFSANAVYRARGVPLYKLSGEVLHLPRNLGWVEKYTDVNEHHSRKLYYREMYARAGVPIPTFLSAADE